MSELTKRSFLNLLFSALKSGGVLIATFVATPILIKLIGEENFGAYRVLLEVYAYLPLIEMGLLTAVITSMLPLIKKGDRPQLEGLMAQGSWRFHKIVLWTFLLGISLYPFLPHLTSWQGPSNFHLYTTFSLLLLSSLLIPAQIYRAYLESMNKGYSLHLVLLAQNILFFLLSVLFAYLGLDLESQALALLLSMIFGALFMRGLSDIKVDFKKRDPSWDKSINSSRKGQVLNELAGKICWQSDQIIIASMLNSASVAKVFFGIRVAQIMQQQLLSLGQSFWASLSTLYFDQGKQDLFRARFYDISKLLAALGVLLLVPVCVLNQAFIRLWVGPEHVIEGNFLSYLACGNAFFHGIFSFWGLMLTVLGRAASLTKAFWIQAFINLAISLAGTWYLGGVGPSLGTLISYILVPFIIYPPVLKRYLELDVRKLYSSVLLPLALGIGVVTALKFSPVELEVLERGQFLLRSAAIFFLNGVLVLFVTFNSRERSELLVRLKRLRKGRS